MFSSVLAPLCVDTPIVEELPSDRILKNQAPVAGWVTKSFRYRKGSFSETASSFRTGKSLSDHRTHPFRAKSSHVVAM